MEPTIQRDNGAQLFNDKQILALNHSTRAIVHLSKANHGFGEEHVDYAHRARFAWFYKLAGTDVNGLDVRDPGFNQPRHLGHGADVRNPLQKTDFSSGSYLKNEILSVRETAGPESPEVKCEQ